MFCKNCGHENAEDVAFCINCGNELNPQPSEPVTPHEDPVTTYAEPALPKASQIMGLIAMICGIVSLVMCLCYGSGIAFAIAALILGILAKKKATEVGLANKKAQLGFTLGLIGTITNALFMVGYFVYLFIVYFMALSSGR